MKILYDHQIFSSQIYGGISRYFYELVRCFAGNADVEVELATSYSNNAYLSGTGNVKPFFPGRKFVGKTSMLDFMNTRRSVQSLSRGGFDIFHPTYYHPYFLKHLGKKPYVVTVHDMVHELYPEMFPQDDQTRAWKKETIHNAAAVIAISRSTRDDLVRLYGLDEQKMSVIWHGNSLCVTDTGSPDVALPGRYLLFVGHRSGYKNFGFFVKAVTPILRSDPELEIVCLGGGSFSPDEGQLLRELRIHQRVKQLSVPDASLPAVYRNAAAFVYPSLYEGFGIPILEAFACGCPVIASDASCFPEVAGPAAVYFDPRDESALKEAVEKVAYDEDLGSELRSKGFQRISEFSWEKTAQATKAVYEGLM